MSINYDHLHSAANMRCEQGAGMARHVFFFEQLVYIYNIYNNLYINIIYIISKKNILCVLSCVFMKTKGNLIMWSKFKCKKRKTF